MNDADDRESRDRTGRTREAVASRSVEAPHTPRRYVGRVVAVPAGVNTPVYLDTNPVAISGDEVAGGSATRSADASRTVPVLVLGSLPAVGQDLVAKNVRGRWVAQVPGVGVPTGGITGFIPDCLCSPTPGLLYMQSGDPACNFHMFQDGTIRWQPAPPDVAGNFTDGSGALVPTTAYFGDQVWPQDEFDGSGTYVATYHFRYYLTCSSNLWTLTRIFIDWPDGSGGTTTFRDGVLYSWVMGASDGHGLSNVCGSRPSTYELNPDFQAWADCIVATYPAYAALEPLDFDPAANALSSASQSALQSIYQDYANGVTRGCGPPPPVSRTTIGGNAFRLDYGSAFPGSDLSCSVTIEG